LEAKGYSTVIRTLGFHVGVVTARNRHQTGISTDCNDSIELISY